jgi:L-ribulose-5-phosphate 3-epimerase UlaE
MSKVAEIAAFVRLTHGGLSIETLAKAIHRRWPEASEDEVREALQSATAPQMQSAAPVSQAK